MTVALSLSGMRNTGDDFDHIWMAGQIKCVTNLCDVSAGKSLISVKLTIFWWVSPERPRPRTYLTSSFRVYCQFADRVLAWDLVAHCVAQCFAVPRVECNCFGIGVFLSPKNWWTFVNSRVPLVPANIVETSFHCELMIYPENPTFSCSAHFIVAGMLLFMNSTGMPSVFSALVGQISEYIRNATRIFYTASWHHIDILLFKVCWIWAQKCKWILYCFQHSTFYVLWEPVYLLNLWTMIFLESLDACMVV